MNKNGNQIALRKIDSKKFSPGFLSVNELIGCFPSLSKIRANVGGVGVARTFVHSSDNLYSRKKYIVGKCMAWPAAIVFGDWTGQIGRKANLNGQF